MQILISQWYCMQRKKKHNCEFKRKYNVTEANVPRWKQSKQKLLCTNSMQKSFSP